MERKGDHATANRIYNEFDPVINWKSKQDSKFSQLTFKSSREDCPVGWEWNQPKCVPECLLLHLETLVWTIFEWQREEEKQVATYILKNARQLKKAIFSPTYIDPKNLQKLEKRREMLSELASVVRASKSCHLVFKPDAL